MRQRGNLRLLLNANLWPEMAINEMDGGKGATFAVVNATDDSAAEADGSGKAADSAAAAAAAGSTSGGDRPSGLTTFAVRFKTAQILSQFVQKTNALKKQAPSAAKVRGCAMCRIAAGLPWCDYLPAVTVVCIPVMQGVLSVRRGTPADLV